MRALLVAALLAVPFVAAQEPLDPVCPDGVDVDGVSCHATPCDPATACAVVLDHRVQECRVNATLDGATCVTQAALVVEVGGRSVGTPTAAPDVRVPGTTVDVYVAHTSGHANGEGLPNDWTSEVFAARIVLLDADVGRTGGALYASSIRVADEGADAHTFRNVGASARHDGAAGAERALVTLFLLDGAPESCAAQATPAGGVGTTCREVQDALP